MQRPLSVPFLQNSVGSVAQQGDSKYNDSKQEHENYGYESEMRAMQRKEGVLNEVHPQL